MSVVYDFKCTECGHEFEERWRYQDLQEGLTPDCPECEKIAYRIYKKEGNFKLKGTGWYSDGY